MSADDLLRKQLVLTQKIIDRMDTMISVMKKELNTKPEEQVKFYTPSGKKEWVGIPDSLDDMFDRVFPLNKTNDIWGDGHSYPENDDDLDQMDACLVRNVAKAQRKTILKMEIEMEALRAIIDDMRGQIKDHEQLVKDYNKLLHDNMRLVKSHE